MKSDLSKEPGYSKTLLVKLLNKQVRIKCPNQQEQQLLKAAEQLDARLTALSAQDSISDRADKLAVTALNLMHELLLLQTKPIQHQDQSAPRIQQIIRKLETAL